MTALSSDTKLSLSPQEILQKYWGFSSFRPFQEAIINAVLSGHDTLALMPTGGGKSLCYQVPALVKDGLCLVISPLIALMKDQVQNLKRKNITAFAIYSGMSRKEVINTLQIVCNSNCKFLYVSPERLETKLFLEYLPGINISLIAVDEAHCISQWGYDFRPPYLRIAFLREELPGIPVLALTASATPDVQIDICDKLNSPQALAPFRGEGKANPKVGDVINNNWKIFRQSFERPNLSYSVFHVDSKIVKAIEILKKVQGSAIVYCKTRRRTKEISDLLALQNISSDYYHAGLPQEERNRKQEEWIQNKTRVIVCTNAFGMGIDKPDVRVVVHADVPDCLENYYQEAGRAGRDGKNAFAVLLYDENDIKELDQSAAIRYPSLDDIKTIYQSVANYLQIPANSGEGQYFDFDITDFIKKFQLNTFTVVYSLKALEQEGWLAFNEQVFLSSSVQFTINKNDLYEFENTHPDLEPAIKALLRAYEGIFDYPTRISELVLVRLLKKDAEAIKKDLVLLHQHSVINYIPQKDTPQLFFLNNRIKTEELTIDMTAYNKRKERFQQRAATMIHFTKETLACRSQLIGHYFGDTEIKKCGVCDNCLRIKRVHLTKDEFEKIARTVETILQQQPMPAKELMLHLHGIKKEKARKVIEHLQAENKIQIDKTGWIRVA